MTSANKPKPPADLLQRAITDDGITEDALDFLADRRIPCPSGNRLTILTLAYAHGWHEGMDLGWKG